MFNPINNINHSDTATPPPPHVLQGVSSWVSRKPCEDKEKLFSLGHVALGL